MANKNTLHLKIATPFQIIYEGEVTSVSSVNSTGKFDVLAQHANFITLVESSPIIVRIKDEQPREFKFPLSIIYAHSNQVNIYTNIQQLPHLGKSAT